MWQGLPWFIALATMLGIPACASHYQHYTAFEASNANGEVRWHRLQWQTVRYPSWDWRSDRATAVRLESQCSDRVWLLLDPSVAASTQGQAAWHRGCVGQGIVACGDPQRDRASGTDAPVQPDTVCMTLTDEAGARRIIDLEHKALLTVSCYPAGPGSGEATGEGMDGMKGEYPRASVVPYPVRIRRAPAGSHEWTVPELNRGACD
ncbi:MAG: hypothetical protein R3296_13160 [Oleiphilaceae bacterium]|nr:hypothetical protein [Oleiphilaceae bacterium]